MRALLAVVLALPLAACSGTDDDQVLTVLAASSLADTFADLAELFEDEHPGTDVRLVLGSSTMLAEQVVDGAPGDVLATADERSMRVAEDGSTLADGPYAFAGNALTLVTPPQNRAGIASLTDLDREGVDYVVCAEAAPCGALAVQLLDQQEVAQPPASQEVDARAVLARVEQGEADAGLVYRTDAVAAGDAVTEVPLPEGLTTNYLVAPLHGDDAERSDLAAEFVTLVRSNRARQVLQDAGFSGVVVE
ncbi:molybdate ABC transporter substrate-binding protein [Nocardioides seonyuensis]|uniref:Molybdate ABC transporter substrate-binding protein n=1 Tax=Nocardioides seonyuensis TaxID=2518371 RepID=A0A4P7ID04_9ACTN|nr:molybdate ABC transporter substrate-binding protein [Nocardioides seonyuensis]QBX54520.1 molybdate ABC transporter substrate-binding protein [Nocardioides seonyuensis]